MKYETTERLEKVLQQVDEEEDAACFIERHIKKRSFESFYEYINAIIAERDLNVTELIENSGISKNYAYHILSGRRKNPSRDKVIAICVAAKLSFTETNRALKIAETGVLYAKDERDVRIAVAINQKIGNVTNLNLILDEKGLKPLDI